MFNPFSPWSDEDLRLADMSDVMDIACEYAAIEVAETDGPNCLDYDCRCETLVDTKYWDIANGWLASEQWRRGITFSRVEDVL